MAVSRRPQLDGISPGTGRIVAADIRAQHAAGAGGALGHRAQASRPVYDRDVPPDPSFVSYAQNREDVVLWRALRGISHGRYLEMRPGLTDAGRATRALYEQGWDGVVVVDEPERTCEHMRGRSRDRVVGVADVGNLGPDPLHLLVLGAGQTTPRALFDVALVAGRPWVVVVDDDEHRRHEEQDTVLTGAGYRMTLFDGVSRFYLADDHPELASALSYPACSRDAYVRAHAMEVMQDNERLLTELSHWRGHALTAWADWAPRHIPEWSIHDERERDSLRQEIDRMRATLSWRVTRPLRAVRHRAGNA